MFDDDPIEPLTDVEVLTLYGTVGYTGTVFGYDAETDRYLVVDHMNGINEEHEVPASHVRKL